MSAPSSRIARLIAATLLAGSIALAQDAPPPTPHRELRLDGSQVVPPVVVWGDGADLMSRLRTTPPPATPPPSGGVSRTIRVSPPPVVNQSTLFRFRDRTDRTAPLPRSLSLPERRAAVEVLRQTAAAARRGPTR